MGCARLGRTVMAAGTVTREDRAAIRRLRREGGTQADAGRQSYRRGQLSPAEPSETPRTGVCRGFCHRASAESIPPTRPLPAGKLPS